MIVHDPLTSEERRIKNKMLTLNRLTDLRARADVLHAKLERLSLDRHRARMALDSWSCCLLVTLPRDRDSTHSTVWHEPAYRYENTTIIKILDVIEADIKAELRKIADEMDETFDAHCERKDP